MKTLIFLTFFTLSNLLIAQETKDECAKKASSYWDSSLNRCVLKQEAIGDRKEYEACEKETDVQKKKVCFDQLAKSEVGAISNKKLNEVSGQLAYTLALTLAGINLTSKEVTTKCKSKTIFNGVAAAGVLGELMTHQETKNKLKKLGKDYAASSDAYTSQLEAFKHLKKEQEIIIKVAKAKKNLYQGLAAGYGIVFATAMVEVVGNIPALPRCEMVKSKSTPATPAPIQSPSSTATTFLNFIFYPVYASDVASGSNPLITLFGAGALTLWAKKGLSEDVKKNLGSSKGIAVVSGLCLAISKSLMDKADEQKKEAEENIKRIDLIMSKFASSIENICPKGHDDMTDIRCYCYTRDYSKHPDRVNSSICKAEWAKKEKNYVPADSKDEVYTGVKGCMFLNGDFDESCRCKNMVDPTSKQNACYKEPVGQIDILATNGINASAAIDGINSVTQGNLAAGTFWPSTMLSSSAALSKKSLDDMTKKTNDMLKNQNKSTLPTLDQLSKESIKLARALHDAGGAQLAKSSGYNFGNGADLSGLNAAKEFITKSEPNLYDNTVTTSKSSRGIVETRKNKSPEFNFNFGKDMAKNDKQLLDDKSYMNKKYDFKDSDINTRDDVSIFKVISNRYFNSGLRRLFDDNTDENKQ